MKRSFNVSEYVIWKGDNGYQVVAVEQNLEGGKVKISWTETLDESWYGSEELYFSRVVKGYELLRYNKKNFKKVFYAEMVEEMGEWEANIQINQMF